MQDHEGTVRVGETQSRSYEKLMIYFIVSCELEQLTCPPGLNGTGTQPVRTDALL